MITAAEIIKAYCRIREKDDMIPDEVLDFMKQSALEKLENIKLENKIKKNYEQRINY